MSETAAEAELDQEASALEKISQYVGAINSTKAPEGAKSKFEARTTAVLDGWSYLINLLESKTVNNFPLVFDMMYLATAKIILSGDWYTARMENNYKNGDKLKGDLLAALHAIKLKAPDDFATEQKCCILLEPLVEVEPWNNVDYMSDILKNDVTDPKVTIAATKLLEKETMKLVDVRLEALCTEKLYKYAFKLGEALYINPYWETEKTDPLQMTEHERSREDLTDFFYLLICSRSRSKSDEGARLMKKHLTIPTAVKVVHRISQNPAAKRIAGRWKEWKKAYETILNATIKFFLNSSKGQEFDPSPVRSLFHEWVKSSDPTDTGEIQPFTDMLNQINQVPIDFVYALADVLYDDFKSLPNAIPNAIELYFRAMSLDINNIAKVEVAEAEAQENSDQTTARKEAENLKQKLQRNLAQRYLRLAEVFSHDTKQAWELTLTAFSLSPSDQLLQKLFHSSDFDTPQGEGFQLPYALQQDLLSMATNPRRKILCWEKDREKLQILCKDHLDTGGPKIKGKKDLVNLEIDYETYKPDRRPEEEDDTGFERGYEPNYIKRLLPKLSRRRIVRKNIIKKPGVVPKRGRPKAAAGLHLKPYNFQRSQQASKVHEGSFDRPKVIYPWKIAARSLIPIARYKHKLYKVSRLKPRIIRLGSFLKRLPPPVATEPKGEGGDPQSRTSEPQGTSNGLQSQVKRGPEVPRISVFESVYLNQLTLLDLEDLNNPSFNEKYLQGTLKLNLDDESDPKEPLREFAELIKDEIPRLLPLPTSSPFVKLTPLPEQFATFHAINYGLDIFLQVIQQGFRSLAIAAEDPNRSVTVQNTPNRSILEVPKGEIPQVIAEVCAAGNDEESPPVNFTNYVPPPKLHLKPGPKSVREKEKIEFIQNKCENMRENLRVKTQALGLTFSDGKLLSACPVPVAADSAGSSGRELVPFSPKISSVQVMEYEDMLIAHACASKRRIENMAEEGESDRLALEGPAAGQDEEGRTLEPPAYVREIIRLVFSGSDRSASPTLSTTSSFPEAFTPAELQYSSDSPAEAYKSEASDYLQKFGVGKSRKIKKKVGPKSMKRQKNVKQKPIEEERPEPPTFDPTLNFPVGRYPLVFPPRPPVEPDEAGMENHAKYSKDLMMFLDQETGLFDEVNEGLRFESPEPDESCGFQSYEPLAGMKDHHIMEDSFPLKFPEDSREKSTLESDINGDVEVSSAFQLEESLKSKGSESDQGPPTKSNKPTEDPQGQGPGPSKKSGTKARSKSAETKRSTSLDEIQSLCNQKRPFVKLERIPLDKIKKKLLGISEESPGPSVERRRTRSSTRSSLADSDADSVCSYKSSRSLELKSEMSDSTDSGRRSSNRRKFTPKKAPEDYAVAKARSSRVKRKNVLSSDDEFTKELVQQKPKRGLSGKKSPKKRGRPKRNKKNYDSDQDSVTSVETVTIDDSESEGPTPGEAPAVLEPEESFGEACGVQAAVEGVEHGQVPGDLPAPQPQGLIVRGVGGDISAPIIISDESESEPLEDPLEVCERSAGPVASVCRLRPHDSEEILEEPKEILEEPKEILEEPEEILDEPEEILEELEEILDEPEEIEEEIPGGSVELCFKTYQEGDTEMIELSVSNENSIDSETENPTEEFRSEDPNQDFCNFTGNEDITEVAPMNGFFPEKIPPGRTIGADGSNDHVIHLDSHVDDGGGGGPQANDIRKEEKETGRVNEEGDDELGALSHIACAGVGSSGPQDPQVDEVLPPLEHTNSYQPPRSATPEGEVSICQEGATEDEVCERIEEIACDQVMMSQEVCELEVPVSEGVQLETLLTVEEDREESKDQQQVQSPLDEVLFPLDQVQSPLNEVQSPLNEVQSPMNEVQSPMNEVQSLLNEVLSLLNEVQGPLDEVQRPLDEVQGPLEDVQSPLNEVQSPPDEFQSPRGEVQSPLGEVQSPLGEVQSPVDEVQAPVDEVQAPVDEVQAPVDEVQAPLDNIPVPLDDFPVPVQSIQSNHASLPVQVYDDGPTEPAGICVDLTTEHGKPLDETSQEDQAGNSPTALSSLEYVVQVPSSPEAPLKSPEEPEQAEKLLEEPERTAREPEEPKQAERSPEEPKLTEKSPEEPKEAERSLEELKQTEKSLEEPKQAERSPEELNQSERSSEEPQQIKKSLEEPQQIEKLLDEPQQIEKSLEEPQQIKKSSQEHAQTKRSSRQRKQTRKSLEEHKQTKKSSKRVKVSIPLLHIDFEGNLEPSSPSNPPADKPRNPPTKKPTNPPAEKPPTLPKRSLRCNTKLEEIQGPTDLAHQRRRRKTVKPKRSPSPERQDLGFVMLPPMTKTPSPPTEMTSQGPLPTAEGSLHTDEGPLTTDELVEEPVTEASRIAGESLASENVESEATDVVLAGISPRSLPVSEVVSYAIAVQEIDLTCYDMDELAGESAMLDNVTPVVIEISNELATSEEFNFAQETDQAADEILIQVPLQVVDICDDEIINNDALVFEPTGTGAEEFSRDAADVNQDAPEVNLDASEVNLDATEINLDASEVSIDASDVNLDAPEVNEVTPDVNRAPDLSRSQNSNSELDQEVIKIEEPVGELAHVVNDEDKNEENTVQIQAPVEQASISSQSMFEDLYDFSPYASETEPDNENVNFNNETKADNDTSPVPEIQALERVEEAPVFQIVQQVQTFERVEEAQAVETVQEALAFEAVQEAPAFETVQEAPAFETVQEAPAFETVQEAQTFETVREVQAPERIEESSPGNLEESSALELSPSIPYAEVESSYESELNDRKIKTEMNPQLEQVQEEQETEPLVHSQVELKHPEPPTEEQQSHSEADAEVRVILNTAAPKKRRRKKALVSPDITVLSSSSKSSRNYTLRGREGITKPKKYYDESFEVGTNPGGVRGETYKVEPPKPSAELVSTVEEPLMKKRKSVTKISLPLPSDPPEESTVSLAVPESIPARPRKPRRFPLATRRKRRKSTARKQKVKASGTSKSAVSVAVTSADGNAEGNDLVGPYDNVVEPSAASIVQFRQPEIISERSSEPTVQSVLLPAISSPVVAPLGTAAVQSDIISPVCPETDGVHSDLPPECPPEELVDPAILQLPVEPFQSLPDMEPALAMCKREIDLGSPFQEWESHPNEIQVVTVKVETIHLPIIPSILESSSENISKESTEETHGISRSRSPGLSRGQSPGLSRAQSPGLPMSLSPIIVRNIPDMEVVLSAGETDASMAVQPESQEDAIQDDMIPVQPDADIVAVKTKRARKSRKTAPESKRRKPSTSTPASQLATERETLSDSFPAEKKQEDPALAKTRDFVVEVEPLTLPAKRLRRPTPAGLALRSRSASSAGSAGQSERKETSDGQSWPKKRRTRIFQSASSSQKSMSQLVGQQPVDMSSVPASVKVEATGSVQDVEEPVVEDVKPVVFKDETPVVLMEVEETKTESTVRNRRKRRPRAESSARKTASSTASRIAASRKSQIEQDQIIMNSSGGYSSSPPVLSCAEDDNTTDNTFSERDNSPPHLDRQV